METHVVIMAGGIGSRLWPVSTPEMPKQFIDLLGVGKSLIQLTVDRFKEVCPENNFWVVTSEKYVATVKAQLPGIPENHILAEPEPRNTAPCIAYACRKVAMEDANANVVVTPSDAIVMDTAAFCRDIRKAVEFVGDNEGVVTVGITPLRPETGYGYIHSVGAVEGQVSKVLEFKEKPNLATAEAYLAEGGYFWNAGIFVWNVRTINKLIARHAPQISGIMDSLQGYFGTPEEDSALAELFPKCDKISIDYAVMEKAEEIYVVPSNPSWSDLGSWLSVKTKVGADDNGNALVGGDIRMFDSRDCIVHAEGLKTVVVDGLQGYIVAQKGDNLLVCRLSQEQRIKEFTANS